MENLRLRNNKIAMAFFAIAIIFFTPACTNEISEVQEVTQTTNLPLRVQYNVHYEYSDSARKQLDITAPEAADFSDKDEPYLEFPKGIHVIFYDNNGNQEATLKANYAKQLTREHKWLARGNVVVVNNRNEELNSEELIWDEREEKIYSEEFVKIITPENVMLGKGFEADQSFSTYRIFNPTGTIEIEEDEGTENE